MAARRVVSQGVQQVRSCRDLHHLHRFDPGAADRLGQAFGDFDAPFDDDLTRTVAPHRVDDILDGDFAIDLRSAAAIDDLLLGRLGKRPQDVGIERVLGIHRAEQRHHTELAALVDANGDAVLLGRVDLDPAPTLGDHPATVDPLFSRLDLAHKVDTRAAMELAHHDALGAIDNELATTEHDRDVTQVDLLFDRLVSLDEPHPHPEGTAIGQAKLATLVRFVPRLAEFVVQVLEPDRLVVALDRKDFLEHRLEPLVLSLLRRDARTLVLQEPLVTGGLNARQVRNLERIATTTEAAGLVRCQTSLRRDSHGGATPN